MKHQHELSDLKAHVDIDAPIQDVSDLVDKASNATIKVIVVFTICAIAKHHLTR